MKKRFLYFVLFIVGFFLGIVIWQPWIAKVVMGEGILLKKTESYKAFNENGAEINARFFLKKENQGKVKVNEIIIRFDDIPLGSRYLILVHDSSWIGSPSQSKKNYKLIFNKWLFQSEVGAKFKIINDPARKDIYYMIERSNFVKDTIRFTTFDELQSLGKEIVIIKQ